MSFQIRLCFTKSLLRRSERLCFRLGFVSLGLCAAILAHVWFFQAYENWAFERELSGQPASVTEFVVQTVSFYRRLGEAETVTKIRRWLRTETGSGL